GGAARSFDVETGTWPSEHDSLARQLALLVEPALDGVLFEEVAPNDESSDRPYEIIAHADGQHVTVLAADLGDWWDVDAVVGLLNTLLRDRESDERLVVLDSGGDQSVTVVGGSEPALREAIAQRLIAPGSGMAAYQGGTAFERQV